MKPQPKKLILGLLLAAESTPVAARDVVRACALFAITESNARVALTRLAAEGMVESAGRGSYRLGPAAKTLARDVSSWREKEKRLRPWTGGYLTVLTGSLGRRDRTALKRRERALHLLGFRELEQGMHLRPDNVEADAEAVRNRLYRLGLEEQSTLFVAHDFSKVRSEQIERLWNGTQLNEIYEEQTRTLEEWMARSDDLDADVAARESFVIGNVAIRHVVFDPLLPEPFVDSAARSRFFDTVRRMTDIGQTIWRGMSGLGMAPVTTRPTLRAVND